jgi:parallel beta-helix repeat protein
VNKLKKLIFASLVILCLLLTISLMGWKIHVQANPTTWNVYVGGSIQETVNNASSGDIIFVHNGTYYEHVVIDKSVSLIGESRDSTIIDGNATGSVVNIIANNISITNFNIRRSGGQQFDSGIRIDYSSGNIITYNKITEEARGISLFSSSDNVVSNNTLSTNAYGISLFSSSDNVVSNNTLSTGNGEGIYLSSSSSNVVSGNLLSENADGVSLSSSDSNVVSGNLLSKNTYGISLSSSSSNVVSGNLLSENYYGIMVLISNDNTIYRNNFANNTFVQVSLIDSTDFWNYDGEGNYWSDYKIRYPNAQDIYSGPNQNESGSDGFWDSPYVIDQSNQDNYPLAGMFSDFAITFRQKTYHVTVISNSTISEIIFEIGSETGNKIIYFNASGADGTVGFCRIAIPTEFMNYTYFILIGNEMIVPTLIAGSNETHSCLYFTYLHETTAIRIISPEAFHLYNELLDAYLKLQTDFDNLNMTYYDLLAYYNLLIGNYSQLQESYRELNSSYQEHLLDYSEQIQNLRNLMYIFAATAAVFIACTAYLSKRTHARS